MSEELKNYSPNELITLVIDKENQLVQKENQLVQKDAEIDYLKHQLRLFQNTLFGTKKETHQTVVPEQTKLLFEDKVDLDLSQDADLQEVSYKRRKGNNKREDYAKLELPSDLPREEVIIEPLDKTDDMVKIGQEETELLAIRPEQFYVKVIIRPKYAKANRQGVVIADLPSRVIPSGKVDESFLATLLIDKYVDHMPIYRQLKKYERLGIKLNDATVGDWVAKGIGYLEILYERLKQKILQERYLQADETTMKVLDKETKGKTHLGYYWVYHAPLSNVCVFDYHPSRGREAPKAFLQDYAGVLQTDGYSVYDSLAARQDGIILAGCMAHARRNFYEAQQNNKSLAVWMLDKIQELYTIERKAREQQLTQLQRQELRQKEALPVLAEMKQWLDGTTQQVVPKSPMGQAINYMRARWEKLIRYSEISELEIDNNLIENAIRPVALGRKNYLFAGSNEAAKRGAIIYTLLACCKMNNINPNIWLEDTLRKLPDTKSSQLEKLLPINKL